MYIIIFEDGSIRSTKKIDESLLEAVWGNYIDIIDPEKMKTLSTSDGDDLIWENIKQV